MTLDLAGGMHLVRAFGRRTILHLLSSVINIKTMTMRITILITGIIQVRNLSKQEMRRIMRLKIGMIIFKQENALGLNLDHGANAQNHVGKVHK